MEYFISWEIKTLLNYIPTYMYTVYSIVHIRTIKYIVQINILIIKFSSKLQLSRDWKINKNIYRKQDIYNYFNIWRSHTRQASPVPIQYKIPITIIIKRCSYKQNFLKIKLVKNVYYLNMYLLYTCRFFSVTFKNRCTKTWCCNNRN